MPGYFYVRAVSDSPVDCLKPDCHRQSVRAFGVAESGFREAEDSGVGYADHTAADQLRAELTRLVEFFGETMFEARFTLAYEPDEAPYHVKELTRREMFEQVGHGSKSGTKQLLRMLPGLRSDEDGGADFRLLLHQRTRHTCW